MKKLIPAILILALCAALLAGCGAVRSATDGNAFATDGDAFATDGDAFATDGDALATDGDALPPETEGNEPAALPVDTDAVTAVLTDLQENYQPGTAGCSLTAARLAGELMDWYLLGGCDAGALVEAATAFGDPGTDEFGVAYTDRLGDVYYAAMGLWGEAGMGLLETAGYTSQFGSYSTADVRAVFSALYVGAGAQAPQLIRVFRSDDQAERFLTFVAELQDVTAETVLEALQTTEVINADVKVNYMTVNEGVAALDLSGEFLPQLQQNGTSGEYMLLGSLVNTFLSAFDARSLLLTVDGQAPETGHNIYDYELGWYNDNVAAG